MQIDSPALEDRDIPAAPSAGMTGDVPGKRYLGGGISEAGLADFLDRRRK
jgi:hypothetical protein